MSINRWLALLASLLSFGAFVPSAPSARFGFIKPALTGDTPDVPRDIGRVADPVEELGAIIRRGTKAERLAAAHIEDSYWRETDTGDEFYDDGANWIWESSSSYVKVGAGAQATGTVALGTLTAYGPSIYTVSSNRLTVSEPGLYRFSFLVRTASAFETVTSVDVATRDGGVSTLEARFDPADLSRNVARTLNVQLADNGSVELSAQVTGGNHELVRASLERVGP